MSTYAEAIAAKITKITKWHKMLIEFGPDEDLEQLIEETEQQLEWLDAAVRLREIQQQELAEAPALNLAAAHRFIELLAEFKGPPRLRPWVSPKNPADVRIYFGKLGYVTVKGGPRGSVFTTSPHGFTLLPEHFYPALRKAFKRAAAVLVEELSRESRENAGRLFEGVDFFDVGDADEEESPPSCYQRLQRLEVGDEVRVCRVIFVVWRTNGGGTIYLTRAGTRGKKLYTIRVTEIEGCHVEVLEVWPGSGDIKEGLKPAATGSLTT